MRSIGLALAACGALTLSASAQHAAHQAKDAKPVATATADIKGDGITGTATFSEVKHGTASAVHVELTVSGLKPGQHGVHLHAIGEVWLSKNSACNCTRLLRSQTVDDEARGTIGARPRFLGCAVQM